MESTSGHVRPPDIVMSCHVSRQSQLIETDAETTTTESYLESVRRAVTTLRLHTEAAVITSSLHTLRECLEKYHTLDLHLLASLESQRIHEDVLICMHNFIAIEEIQTAACSLLTLLMSLSWDIAQDLITKDGHQSKAAACNDVMEQKGLLRRIQRVLDYHMSDEKVQVAALHTFICFIQSAPIRKKVLYEGGDVVGHLTRAMSVFQESSELQSVSCRALCILLQEEPNLQADMLKCRDYTLVLTALKCHFKCRDVAREGCSLLHLLTHEAAVFLTVLDGTLQTLIHDRVHMAMVRVTRQHSKCEETMEPAYGVLSILSFEEDVLHAIASADMESDLMDALMKFIRNAEIQCHCFTIFTNILTYDDELTYDRPDGQEVHWLKQVYIAMSQHRDASGVQVACCRVLAQLLELYPELNENIGEDVDMSQDPLHILCFGALLMHHHEMSVVVAACNAIYWLSADNERIQQQLMQKNAYIGLIHAMKIHSADPSVQAAGCRALRGLAIFSQDSKETISWHGDLSDIFRPLSQYPDNLEVQTEGIAVLACLADTELVRTVCLVDELHERILTAMDAHEDSPLLHEVSLEALSILCAADGGSTVLYESGAIERVLSSMKMHWNNAVIQRKGLVLLQLLLDHITTSLVADQTAELAKVICAAMSEHEDEIGLQTEGCVAMLVLAEKGEFASIQLVDAQAHAHLFHILQDLQDQKKLVELANECLFVLGCERNLKSQMLQYACAQGLTRGVECLIQLGAEVNVGSGTDTPLCHACCHGDEYMVGLLLRQGVTDLQTALQLTLRMEQHNLAGLILSHCDRHGGIVSWSGLGLEGLRPEWLEPTFLGGPSRAWQVSETGKLMAHRIQKTEEKRSRRQLERTLSAPAPTTPTRRMSLRYSFEAKQKFGNKEELEQKLQENYPQLRNEEQGLGKDRGPEGKGPLARIKRKLQYLRNRRFSSPAATLSDKGSLRTRSELIRSLSTSTFSLYDQSGQEGDSSKVDIAEFVQCPDELREWRETTLTGSNVPFSSFDPRKSKQKSVFKQPQSLPGEWQRKSPFRKSRRHSESFLMISHLRRSSSSRSLRSLSASSHQGVGDDSSIGSHGTYDVFSECTTPARLLAPTPSYPRKRASTTRHTYSESESPVLRPIRDNQSRDGPGAPSLSEATFMGSTSNLLLQASPVQTTARRCRSVTFGDSPVAISAEKIIQLDLSSNSIRDLGELLTESHPSLLSRFNDLTKLDLSQNQLKSIPDALFKFMTKLRHLNVSGNHLTQLPVAAINCPHLSTIDFSNNQIEDFSLIANRVSFTVKNLNLSHNALQTLPQWLAKTMPRLETLNLYGNRISSLPEEPLVLKSLRVLDLSHNHIKVIPDLLLSQANALETLALSGNEIDVLPSEELASILSKLAVVKLSHNQLSGKEPFYIPKFLLELKSLRSLDVSHNQLTGLPEPSLWKANMLREINASHNSIRKLTLSQARLWPTLERLALAHNKLNEVPPEIGQLVSLSSLDISHNEKLTTIPDEMGRLQKLWELTLDGLKLDLDEGLTRGRTKDLIGYLHEKLKRSVEYYHMKMMVVGYGGRGKSTLLRSLTRQKQPDRSLPTVGVVVRDWTFRGRSLRAGTVTYTLSTWDFAGQEEFYSTHQCFLSNRALYLVIYNLSKGPSEVEMLRPWLVNIQARAPNCPVIVVGTHMDTLPRDDREDRISDMRQRITEMCERPGFPDLKGLVEVNSTQESPPLDRLRILVKDVLDNFKVKGQHVMGQKIPESYVKLQELLSEESRNLRSSLPIIKHGRLVKIAKDAELDLDEEELQQAVRFLHESGALLHYDDSALQLNALYFVDPEWLCRMMAQVVTVREINPFISPKGILRKENVRLLFTGKRVGDDVFYTFPPSLIPQYLRLLERFEIALPQNNEELLVPSRLPLERPTFIHPIPEAVNHPAGPAPRLVQRRYGLSYTPIGLWSRLLTRLMVLLNSSLPELDVGKRSPLEVSYWREGIYIYYNQESFVLVSSEGGNNIIITAPGTRYGARLLSEVVDHVDILMDEWYPGLLEISPTGESLVKITVPCPDCQVPGHVFGFEELVSLSDLEDAIDCPLHNGQVLLSLIVPDVVLGDMDERHFLKQEDFTLVQRPEHVLGEGTFGCVYRAQYKKQAVAVKIFSKVGESHPYKMMRQEATILRRLHHPSLVGLVGFGLRPRVIVLELAPLGSLGGLLRSRRIRARTLQQRIAFQVADGLKFLHDHSIIYRDMKPDNILIYNLSLAVVINAKISDYGISRLATPSGLTLPEGTPGYRGPEVVKGEPYSVQADIYSFGITLYEMVTGGQHPYSELGFRSEVDDAVLKGRRVDPVTKKGVAPWPDMEDLIDRSLHPCPDNRPTSGQIVEILRSVEVLSLRRAVAVSKELTIECMEVRGYGEDDLEVWVASGEKNEAQLSWLSLTSHTQEPKGMMFTGSRVLCMEAVGQSNVLLGTQAGTISVYDAWQHCCKHTLPPLPDSILCLEHYDGYHDQDFVFVGLANGQLAIYKTKDIITDSKAEPEFLQVGGDREPLRVMFLDSRARLLYMGTGAMLHVLSLQPTPHLKESFSTIKRGQPRELISQLIVQGKYAHVGKKGQSRIEMWHLDKHRLQRSVDLNDLIPKSGEAHQHARVTSMVLVGKSTLWVGTGEGAIVLLDSATYQHIITMFRHTGTIRSLLCARVLDQFSAVIAGGLGFSGDTQSHEKDDDDHGYLTIWDPDIPQHKHAAEENERRRQDWHVRNQRKPTDQAPAAEPTSQGQGHLETKAATKAATRRTSFAGMARLVLGKNKDGTAQSGKQEQRRRHSQIPVYDRSSASFKAAEADPGTAFKRGSLTPSMEYVKLKRASVHGSPGPQRSAARPGEATKKRASLQHAPLSLDSGTAAYASSPGKEGTLEIGKIMKMRKRSSAGLGGSPREQRGMAGRGEYLGSVSPTLETVNQEESNL